MVDDTHTAILQTLGIELYDLVEKRTVKEYPWLTDVFSLLGIESSACVFENTKPRFDRDSQTLYLPKFTYDSDSQFKKSVWLAIRPDVEADGA